MNAGLAKHTRDKTRELQRALYRAAKASATRRFHALYDKVSRDASVCAEAEESTR